MFVEGMINPGATPPLATNDAATCGGFVREGLTYSRRVESYSRRLTDPGRVRVRKVTNPGRACAWRVDLFAQS